MFGSRRDPRQARLVSAASVRWVLRNRAYTPYHLVRYWRLLLLRLRHPHVIVEGMVFLGRGVELTARRGYGRLILGAWSHYGDRCALRAHEGTVRTGAKVVLGSDVTVNAYLDGEIGASTLIADRVYITDFDHVTDDLGTPIKDQGIVKSPVRIGPDCWLGTGVVVTRGVTMGRGSVAGANAVVTRDVPAHAVVGGVPARVLRSRLGPESPGRPARPSRWRRIPAYRPVTSQGPEIEKGRAHD